MNTREHRRLYTPQQMAESRAAWDAMDISASEVAEWKHWRHVAAMDGGIIQPPEGTRWDSWTEHDPSQRAILVRAIRETPELLLAAIRAPGPPTWAKVIAILVRSRNELRDQGDREAQWERQQRTAEPTRGEAAESLRTILARLA